jgi:cell division septation protein DedD
MFSTVQEIPKADPQIVSSGFGAAPPSSGQMTLGNRQLAAVFFVILTMLTLVASVAYLAGRMVTPVIATATEPKPSESRAPEQVYVVDDAQKVSPAPTAAAAPPRGVMPVAAPAVAPVVTGASTNAPAADAPVTSVPVVNTVAAPAPAAAAPISSGATARPIYWQVASVDRGMAEVSVEYLKKNGMPAIITNGTSPSLFRVLVGPADTAETAARLKAELTKLGFTPFPKRM